MKKSILLTGIGVVLSGAAVYALAVRGTGEDSDAAPARGGEVASAAAGIELPPTPPSPALAVDPETPAAATPEAAGPAVTAAASDFDVAAWDPRLEPPSEPFQVDPDGTAYYVVPTKHVRNGKPEKGHAVLVLRPVDQTGVPLAEKAAESSPK